MRGIARLTQSHEAYRSIGGGVPVNYHSLADFRSQEGDALDDLLTDHVASLVAAGAVKLKTNEQDGMRVRASAGASSFRREERLEACLEAARQQLATLEAQLADDPAGESARKQAARLRAVSEREARIEAALARRPELAAIKKQQGKDPAEARSSTSDADATIMKMGDGGFCPAFNFQYASETESQVIAGVEVDSRFVRCSVSEGSRCCSPWRTTSYALSASHPNSSA